MRTLARIEIAALILISLTQNVFAVSQYHSEPVPARIPYQRSFLVFYKGSETLILQNKYEMLQTASAKSFGWVVPVPSVPEITSLEPDNARYFFTFIARMTMPNIINISEYIIVLLLLICGVFCLLYPIIFLILLIQSRIMLGLKLLPWFLIALIYVFLTLPHLNRASNIADAEVIKSEMVGIYDVQVIQSDSENEFLAWLKKNGFKYSDSDIDIFKYYIEKQWCFVVAKIEPSTERGEIAYRGMVAPLILKFKSDKAIYPMSFTSLTNKEMEVLIYTLTENKQTCDDRMTLKRSSIAETQDFIRYPFNKAEQNIETIFKDLPAKMNICKFKAKLTSEKMKSDIVFEDAADNELYQETKVIW